MSHPSTSNDSPTHSSSQQLGPLTASNRPWSETEGSALREHDSPTASSLLSVASLTGVSQPGSTPALVDMESPVLPRPLGVHGMLNPSTDQQQVSSTQQRIRSPSRSVSAMYAAQPAPSFSPKSRKRGDRSSPVHDRSLMTDPRSNRRILTPKSPATRAASYGARPTSPIVASGRYPPGSSEGRVYTAEPGTTRGGIIPPLPPLSAAPPSTLPPLSTAENVSSFGRHLPPGAVPYSSSGTLRASPDMPYSSFDRRPGSPFPPIPAESNTSTSNPSAFQSGGVRPPQRTYTGQTAYQLNLETGQVPLNIDFQQASKLADEKRKRNAGASARFRQRRKEKEQAASHAIADLQRRVREAQEDRDFYMMERNYFRDMVARTLGAAQIPPRPPSPHLRRAQAGPLPLETSQALEYQRDESPEAPSQRRRTSEYQRSYASASPMAPTAYLSYSHLPSTHYALPPPTGQNVAIDPRSQHSAPTPTTTGPQLHDPFRRDILR